MEKESKIYVSGHCGMVGSAMIRKLTAEGYTNIVTRTHAELDLTCQADVEAFFAAERPEYVFHIAAKTGGVMLNKEFPTEYLADGTLIALNVLQAANKHGAHGAVFTASANIYPEGAPQPMGEELLHSGKTPFFWGGYALAKEVGVKFCECAHRQFGKRFIAAILPAVYGLNDWGTTVMPMLIDKFAGAVTLNEPVVDVWGTGKALREFINSDDLCDALVYLMEHYGGGEHINVGSGDRVTIQALVELLKDISGFKGELIFDATKPDSANAQFLDNTKITALGWKPCRNFRDGVEEVYLEHLQRVRTRTQEY